MLNKTRFEESLLEFFVKGLGVPDALAHFIVNLIVGLLDLLLTDDPFSED